MLLGDAQGDRKGKGALAGSDVAAEHHEVTPAETAAEELVEAGKIGGNRVGGRSAIGHGIDTAQQERQGGDVGAARHGPR